MLLVTGITGHSGGYFLKRLVENDDKSAIRCLIRENSDTTFLDSCDLRVEKVICDLDSPNDLDESMTDIDEVLHITSIFYSEKIVAAAIRQNVRRIICVHTTGIFSKHRKASRSYKIIEDNIRRLIIEKKPSLKLIILRPTMIFGSIYDGNMAIFIKIVDHLRLVPLIGNGKNLLQPVNGEDLGNAYYELILRKDISYGDYILSGESPISMKEVMESISRLLGKKRYFVGVPMSLSALFARLVRFVTFNRVDLIEEVQRMGEDRSFPHAKAQNDFGYRPMPFLSGLRREVDEYLRNK